jgi:formamidase
MDDREGSAMTLRIHVNPDVSIVEDPVNSHNRIWPALDPVAAIDPGDELRDGMDGGLGPDRSSSQLGDLDLDANHPLTGPVEVRGARPGDLLAVELLALGPGRTVRPP